jgi:hypothetical protein
MLEVEGRKMPLWQGLKVLALGFMFWIRTTHDAVAAALFNPDANSLVRL